MHKARAARSSQQRANPAERESRDALEQSLSAMYAANQSSLLYSSLHFRRAYSALHILSCDLTSPDVVALYADHLEKTNRELHWMDCHISFAMEQPEHLNIAQHSRAKHAQKVAAS